MCVTRSMTTVFAIPCSSKVMVLSPTYKKLGGPDVRH